MPTTVKNPTANSVVERVHLTMGDMLRTKSFQANDTWTWHDEIDSILQSIAWAIHSTINASIKRSPGQLVFSRDMIMPLNINTNWNDLRAMRKRIALANNVRENATHISHEYEIGQKVIRILTPHER